MAEKWKLNGTYFETCNCNVACPCIFLSAPTNGECTVLVGWHIDDGNFSNVSLSGLNVALVAYSPGHMLETKWRVALYLDEGASEDQKNALIQIFTGQAGGHMANLVPLIGEVLGVDSAPIQYDANGKQRRLKIANKAEAEIEGIQDQTGADVAINNAPLCISPGYPLAVAKSTRFNFKDHGIQCEISGKNGFYSPFSYMAN